MYICMYVRGGREPVEPGTATPMMCSDTLSCSPLYQFSTSATAMHFPCEGAMAVLWLYEVTTLVTKPQISCLTLTQGTCGSLFS
jgi:hypothetical protein